MNGTKTPIGSNGNIGSKYVGLFPSLVRRLIYVIIVMVLWYWLGVVTLLIVVGFGLGRIMFKSISVKEKFKASVRLVITIGVLYTLIYFLGGNGVLGFIILMLCLAAFKIYISKDLFMGGIRDIETMIWGSPAEDRKKWLKKKKE